MYVGRLCTSSLADTCKWSGDPLSDALPKVENFVEMSVSSGVLGRGKSTMSKRAVGAECFDEGCTASNGWASHDLVVCANAFV